MAPTTTAEERYLLFPSGIPGQTLRLRAGLDLSRTADFFHFCQDNAELHIERSAQGELIIEMPTRWGTGKRNALLNYFLVAWALQDGTGEVGDSNTGFELPNGGMRAPAAAWVDKDRLAALTIEQRSRFLPLAPDFIVELRSDTDRLADLETKMEEWRAAGVRLGLLLDASARRVCLYRPGQVVAVLENPTSVDCSPELSGFVLDVKAIFDVEV
jgi:Uma2 family endonuclease